MRLLFVINSMGRGGAEVQTKQLAIRLAARGHQVLVLVLQSFLDFEDELFASGVETRALGIQRGAPNARPALELIRILRSWRPDVVQTMLYASDLLGGLAARATRTPVAWGIRCSSLHPGETRSLRLMRLNARLSRVVPNRVFANSEAGRSFHVKNGYDARKMCVIPNGFDTDRYRPNPELRARVRHDLGIGVDELVIGIVARFDPHKDHATFFRAAGRLHRALPDVRFLVVGRELADNEEVRRWVRDAGVHDRCLFTNERSDLERLYNAMDLATLTSMAEGFPNVIGEAMACGVACVATDAGDCASVIGDTGLVVPVADADGLARSWEGLLRASREERVRRGLVARDRIVDRFSVEVVTSHYEREWEALAQKS